MFLLFSKDKSDISFISTLFSKENRRLLNVATNLDFGEEGFVAWDKSFSNCAWFKFWIASIMFWTNCVGRGRISMKFHIDCLSTSLEWLRNLKRRKYNFFWVWIKLTRAFLGGEIEDSVSLFAWVNWHDLLLSCSPLKTWRRLSIFSGSERCKTMFSRLSCK